MPPIVLFVNIRKNWEVKFRPVFGVGDTRDQEGMVAGALMPYRICA